MHLDLLNKDLTMGAAGLLCKAAIGLLSSPTHIWDFWHCTSKHSETIWQAA